MFFLVVYIIGINILVQHNIYGGIISHQNTEYFINVFTNQPEKLKMFEGLVFCDDISIDVGHLIYISTLFFPTICKYQIRGIGLVPRWNPLHKHIEQYYNTHQ